MDADMLQQLEMIVNGMNPQSKPSVENYTNKAFLIKTQECALRRVKSHEDVTQVKNSTNTENSNTINEKSSQINFNSATIVKIIDLTKNQNVKMAKKIFLCRNITPAYRTKSLVTVVEDPEGKDAVLLRILNFPHFTFDIQNVLPVGKILAVKDPLFTSDTLDNTFTLVVDDPNDVIFISEEILQKKFPGLTWNGKIPKQYQSKVNSIPGNERVKWKSVEEWKNEGNRFFVQKKFQEAVNCYTEGLKESPGDVEVCCNRSAAYINLGYFYRGLEDAEKALEKEPSHVKAIFRKSKCLGELHRCPEALQFLNEKTAQYKQLGNVKELVDLKEKLEKLTQQSKTGKYDVAKLYQNPMQACNDVGEYFGPLKIEGLPGRGRGLVATEDIPPGKLLIASKAFAIVYPDELNSNQGAKREKNISGQKELVKKVAEKLMIEPEHRKTFYHLCAGSNLNPTQETEDCNKVDMNRIDLICSFNGFGGHCDPKVKGHSVNSTANSNSNGIWILPSYVNHSCWDCNSFWMIFGNLMMIRSFKNIQRGEEILMPYVNPQDVYEIRAQTFEKHNFTCNCTLCDLDRKDSADVNRQRKSILQQIASCPEENILLLKTLVTKLENLREINANSNVSIVFPYRQLGECYFGEGQFKNAIEVLAKGHKIIQNSPMVHFAVNYSMNIVAALFYDKCKKKAWYPWVDILKRDLMTAYGCLSILKLLANSDTLASLAKNRIHFEDHN